MGVARIGISGKICGGKTETCLYLERVHGYRIMSFATPLKELAEAARQESVPCDQQAGPIIRRLFGQAIEARESYVRFRALRDECEEELHQVDEQGNPVKPRVFLQKLGSLFRELDVDVWAKDLVRRAAEFPLTCCDDLRYQNEARILRDSGWGLVRCALPEEVRLERFRLKYGEPTQEVLTHPSEIDLDAWPDWDCLLDTNVPLEQQAATIEEMLRGL